MKIRQWTELIIRRRGGSSENGMPLQDWNFGSALEEPVKSFAVYSLKHFIGLRQGAETHKKRL